MHNCRLPNFRIGTVGISHKPHLLIIVFYVGAKWNSQILLLFKVHYFMLLLPWADCADMREWRVLGTISLEWKHNWGRAIVCLNRTIVKSNRLHHPKEQFYVEIIHNSTSSQIRKLQLLNIDKCYTGAMKAYKRLDNTSTFLKVCVQISSNTFSALP